MQADSAIDVSVVVPVYNNAATVAELAQRIFSALPTLSVEIVFVNDGSRDGSLAVLRQLAASNPLVRVLSLSRNFGQHPAISAGFGHANGQAVVLMDADLQDAPEDLPQLVTPVLQGETHIVYTTRKALEAGSGSRLTSRLFHFVFSRVVGAQVPPNIGTYRAFSRKVLIAINSFPEVNAVYGPLMLYMGFDKRFIEVTSHGRAVGKSSYTFTKRMQLAASSLISYTSVPHTFLTVSGLVVLTATLLYSLATLVQYLFFGVQLAPGLTLIVILLMFMLGSLMTSLGIIGSYVFRAYQEVLRRPRYLIEETLNP